MQLDLRGLSRPDAAAEAEEEEEDDDERAAEEREMAAEMEAALPVARVFGRQDAKSAFFPVMKAGGVVLFSRQWGQMEKLVEALKAFRSEKLGGPGRLTGYAAAMFLILDEADGMRGSTTEVVRYEKSLAKLLLRAACTVDVSATNLLCFVKAIHQMSEDKARRRRRGWRTEGPFSGCAPPKPTKPAWRRRSG